MNELQYDPTKGVTAEELHPGLKVWATVLDQPVVVKSVSEHTVIFKTVHGRTLPIGKLAITGTMFCHMLGQQESFVKAELRVMAHNMIEQGHRMIQLLDQMGDIS